MTSIADQIRERNRLARMRQGQDVPEPATIPSMPDIKIVMVPLTEAETQQGVILAAKMDVLDNAAGMQARNRQAILSDLWHAIRDPADPNRKVFERIEELTELGPNDIDGLEDQLTILMDYASPAIDGFTEADLAGLKKAFGLIDWSELTGRQWAAVKLCISVLLPDVLLARSLGNTSPDSLTTTSESDESTLPASQS